MLIGHQKQWQFFKKAAEADKLSHAYLFFGQEKIGKKTLALEFAKWLFGEDIQKRQHPDFIFIEPQEKNGESSVSRNPIQISQIRELNWRLSLKPSSAPFKIAVLDQAHTMNSEAQSCFLKTLEEPRGKAVLFLITEYPEMLFSTILSRVQKINFSPVPKKEIEDYLQKKGEKETAEIIEFSQGRPGQAIDFVSDRQKLKEQKKFISDLIRISNSDLALRFQYVKELASKSRDLRPVLEIWLKYFRDTFILAVKGKGARYSFLKLKNIINAIQKTNFLLSTTNVNPRLALEMVMMEL